MYYKYGVSGPSLLIESTDSIIIITKMRTTFQKVSICVLTHLIGQNNRAVCKRHGMSWRCIALRAREPAGPATVAKHARVFRASIESSFKQSENVAIALESWASEPPAKRQAQ